jgi:hypothetical protein
MAYEDVYRSLKVKSDLFVGGSILGPGLVNTPNKVWYVDGNLAVTGTGKSWGNAFLTIQEAVTACNDGDVIYIAPIDMAAAATDPGNYAEKIVIPATKSGISLIGITGLNRTQGGLPQIKFGGASGTRGDPLLTIRACGCLIKNLGFNGVKAADGTTFHTGILLDDDNSTKTAIGTTIMNCHFKNCEGTTGDSAKTGGAIAWAATGGAWQVLIKGNRFYKNVCDVCLKGTSQTVPQDVIIEDNIFSGPLANVDCNLYLAGGSGMNGVIVRNNEFPCAQPALSAGTVKLYADLTGCVGIFSGNRFGAVGTTAGWGAAKAVAALPTTVGIVQNYSDAGLIVREA